MIPYHIIEVSGLFLCLYYVYIETVCLLSAPVSRALGIPCRVVTNFSSAHDGNANLLIEKMYDEDGERLSDPDSVWSVHV